MKEIILKLQKAGKLLPDLDVQAKLSAAIILCMGLSILLFLAILDDKGQFVGGFGAILGSFLEILLGRVAFVVPLALFFSGIIMVHIQANAELVKDVNNRLIWGLSIMVFSLAGFLNLIFNIESIDKAEFGGGIFGFLLYPFLLGNFGYVGGFLIIVLLGFFGFFLVSQLTIKKFLTEAKQIFSNPAKFWDLIPDIFEVWKKKPTPTISADPDLLNIDLQKNIKPASVKQSVKAMDSGVQIDEDLKEKINQAKDNEDIKSADKIESKKETNQIREVVWHLPPFDLLKQNYSKKDPGDIDASKEKIKKTLESFGISVEMADVVVGPTVSQYTLKPASGVKLSAIDSVQRDLGLALATPSIRLESPVGGKSLVGVEIPNKVKSQVRLRDLIQTKKFVHNDKDLPIPVGLDVAGQNLIYSMSKMPHLLVAGATGSGKSVWINSMLLSLLYKYSPQELQLVLVDMKRVELKLYDGIPHLLSAVITEADKAINALKWTLLEMDRRYKILEESGKRNIADYNDFVKGAGVAELEELPFIVFVVDELGDLMMLAKNEVEPVIVRLTQMSRAVGIHLVLGTQRPDTSVVTGLIKANVPSRIAFAVASQIDSRVILDQGGAEKLLGQGDGLFISPSHIQPVRFQGPNIEEDEVKKVIKFLKEQVSGNEFINNLDPSVIDPPKVKMAVPGMSSSNNDSHESKDDFYEKARSFVIREGKASTSLLQTALGIGYPKARKIIDILEEEGIVGPANGSKPRDVYLSFDGEEF
jgi:S-DNA-T family DNA segregation ATPase FtsK/SpoIIIE